MYAYKATNIRTFILFLRMLLSIKRRKTCSTCVLTAREIICTVGKYLLYIPTVHMYHVMCTLHVYVEVLLPPRDRARDGGCFCCLVFAY